MTETYTGSIYIRPVMRGIRLEDAPNSPYLEEWIEGILGGEGHYNVTITVTKEQ